MSIALDDFLHPIPGDLPAGEDLRYSGLFDRLTELRREDDLQAPQGIWESQTKLADWGEVISLASDALKTQTKDLQVTVWLTEALLMKERLPGLADGLELLEALCRQFWPNLHPEIDDSGDLDGRLSPIYWIDVKLSQRLMTLPLTQGAAIDDTAGYSWQTWLTAQRLEALHAAQPRDFEQAVSRGEITVVKFMGSARGSPDRFYVKLRDDLGRCLTGCQRLIGTLDTLCGNQAPSLRHFQGLLEEMTALVDRILTERGLGTRSKAAPPASPIVQSTVRAMPKADPGAASPTTLPTDTSGIGSREEAYNLLRLAANYLLETEPHSPVPYLVQRAISWGQMPLNQVMAELLNDDRSRVFNLLKLPSVQD